MSMIVKTPLPIVQQRDEMSTFPETGSVHFFSLPMELRFLTNSGEARAYDSVLWKPLRSRVPDIHQVSFKKKVFSSLRRICGRQTDSLRRSDPEQPTAYISENSHGGKNTIEKCAHGFHNRLTVCSFNY